MLSAILAVLVLFADAALQQERGLLLLKSDPAGCEIAIDGVSAGQTPRLITDLPADGTYTIRLTKEGYVNKTMTIRFSGRTPIVREEKMVPDAGTLEISSEPSGALVMVNGIARGQTPVTVPGIAKGGALVTLMLAGFETETRKPVLRAGETQSIAVQLQPKAGTMSLTSVPEGARFYVNGEPRGTGPLVLPDLSPAVYEVRCELEGYADVTRLVTIDKAGAAREEFRLSNIMGRLEVRTDPVGATVILDGRTVGMTKPSGLKAGVSDILAIENVTEGEHVLIVRKDGYADSTRHPKIRNSKTSKANVRLERRFEPDIELITDRGPVRGMLISSTPSEIVVEVSLGITRTYSRAEIRGITSLK